MQSQLPTHILLKKVKEVKHFLILALITNLLDQVFPLLEVPEMIYKPWENPTKEQFVFDNATEKNKTRCFLALP